MSAPMIQLEPRHISIIPISGTAFIIGCQKGSDADQKITAFLQAQQSTPDPVQKKLIGLPPVSAEKIGSMCVWDNSFLVLIKAGDETGRNPNATELEILKLINAHGRKVPRQ